MAGLGRPYIGNSQNDSIVELTLGSQRFGRLTGDETGGLGNPEFRSPDRAGCSGSQMGADIAWLLPAALDLHGGGPVPDPSGTSHRSDPAPR